MLVDCMTESLERAHAKQKDARLADKNGIAQKVPLEQL